MPRLPDRQDRALTDLKNSIRALNEWQHQVILTSKIAQEAGVPADLIEEALLQIENQNG